MQLLWLACGAVRQDLDWQVLFLNLIGEAGLQVLHMMGLILGRARRRSGSSSLAGPAARSTHHISMVRLSHDM
jgi:hypothetical protein